MKLRILVIDDEEIVLKSCNKILSEKGYNIQITQTGTEGLQKLISEDFDVVLVDLKMPDIDGMEVLKRAIKLHPDIIIIVITGYSTVQTAVEAINLGAYGYIPKPFTPDELVEALQKALNKRKQADGELLGQNYLQETIKR